MARGDRPQLFPKPSTCLAVAPHLQPPQEWRFAARRIPELPCDHAGAVPGRVLVSAAVPQIDMPAEAINGLAAHAAEAGTLRVGALSIWRGRRSECGRQTLLAITSMPPDPAAGCSAPGRQGAR